MILETMYSKYNLLKLFKNELTNKGYSNKILAWLDGQISLLDELIAEESLNILDELLRKTNFRLLKKIDKGMYNLVDINNNPYEWQLGLIEENTKEWLNKDALIFSTEFQTLVFSKNIDGYKYHSNKWQ